MLRRIRLRTKMSDVFLDYMTEEEYNSYHRELFGNKWKDVKHKKTKFTILERIKLFFSPTN